MLLILSAIMLRLISLLDLSLKSIFILILIYNLSFILSPALGAAARAIFTLLAATYLPPYLSLNIIFTLRLLL